MKISRNGRTLSPPIVSLHKGFLLSQRVDAHSKKWKSPFAMVSSYL